MHLPDEAGPGVRAQPERGGAAPGGVGGGSLRSPPPSNDPACRSFDKRRRPSGRQLNSVERSERSDASETETG